MYRTPGCEDGGRRERGEGGKEREGRRGREGEEGKERKGRRGWREREGGGVHVDM